MSCKGTKLKTHISYKSLEKLNSLGEQGNKGCGMRREGAKSFSYRESWIGSRKPWTRRGNEESRQILNPIKAAMSLIGKVVCVEYKEEGRI